jgi:uncharacterized protein (TIGR01777 family)
MPPTSPKRESSAGEQAAGRHVLVTGSHGLIGSALVTALETRGDRVTRVGRNGERLELDALDGADAVVHLAGAGIGDARWTEDRKRIVRDSRLQPTTQLVEAIAALPADRRPRVLVSGSAIGFYGDRGDEPLTEESGSGDGFLAELCRAWEAAALPAEDAGVRVVRLRTGLVLSPDGGLLEPLMLPFKLGLGGPIGSGRQWFSWIHIDDEVGAILHALDHDEISGPLNATAPNPVTYREFARTLGAVLHRPAVIPTPSFAVALKLGKEGAKEMTLSGQKVLSEKLGKTGYRFAFTDLKNALENVVRRS